MASKALLTGVLSLAVGGAVAFFNMFRWSGTQELIGYSSKDPGSLVLGFYAAQALSTVLVVLGLYLVYRVTLTWRAREATSIPAVMGEALSSRAALRLGAAVAIAYGFLYAVFSSLITYQPTVNFARVYGVSQTSWTYLTCCGDTGTVPKLIVYLSPSLHLGMVLVPLSLLFLFVVPILVGFNVALELLRPKAVLVPDERQMAGGLGRGRGALHGVSHVRGPLPCQLDRRDRDDARGGPRPLPAPLHRRHDPGAPRRPALHCAQREAVVRGHVQGPARARDHARSVLDNCLNHHPAADGEV